MGEIMFKFGTNQIEIDYNIMLKNNIPILTKDKTWIKLFGEIKNKEVDRIKQELQEQLNTYSEAKKEKVVAGDKKRKMMVDIINLSHRVNNGDEKNSLEQLKIKQEEMLELNDIIDQRQFELETIPSKVRKLNYELLKETVRIAYEELKVNEKEFECTKQEIETYRETLKQLIAKKNDYEEKINDTYKFIHGMLGSDAVDKLDKALLEK